MTTFIPSQLTIALSHAKDLLQQEQKKAEVQVVETQNEAKAAQEQLGQHW